MMKNIFAAMVLSSAVAFAPVVASAHYTGYPHHHYKRGAAAGHGQYYGQKYAPSRHHFGYQRRPS